MKENDRASVLAAQIAEALSRAHNGPGDRRNGGGTDWPAITNRLTEDPHIANAVRIELAKLGPDSQAAHAPVQPPTSPKGRKGLAEYWSLRLKEDPHALDVLSALVMDDVDDSVEESVPRGRQRTRSGLAARWHDGWMRREAAVIWMNVLILVPVLVVLGTVWAEVGTEPTDSEQSVAILKLFIVWVLSFVPCWLYVRFLGQRAGALWGEFVVHLHRLRWDEPRYLPRPPKASEFYEEWLEKRGYLEDQRRNLYRQKFNAYYGRAVSTAELGTDFRVTVETMFPVFLSTAVLSASWVAVLWDTTFVENPNSVWDILKFGFLGAYAFTVQSLIRRFFQSDLRPSAYAAALLRLIVVFTTLLALYQLMVYWQFDPATQAVVAFVVGGFPLVGVYALHRTAAVALRGAVPQLTPPYPLSQIDGLNVWYEARLLEEGIEDMENLATANLVDIILHTRVPVGRLIDWVDQAYLYLHLDRMEVTQSERRRAHAVPKTSRRGRAPEDGEQPPAVEPREQGGEPKSPPPPSLDASLGPNPRAGTKTRTHLRQLGIRTATDLLKAFPPSQIDPYRRSQPASTDFKELVPDWVDQAQIRTLVRVLDEDVGLAPIWNWQTRGVRAKAPSRRPRSAQRTARGAAEHSDGQTPAPAGT